MFRKDFLRKAVFLRFEMKRRNEVSVFEGYSALNINL